MNFIVNIDKLLFLKIDKCLKFNIYKILDLKIASLFFKIYYFHIKINLYIKHLLNNLDRGWIFIESPN